MTIDWFAFVVVALATLVSALVVVGSYGLGVRLLAVAAAAGALHGLPLFRGLRRRGAVRDLPDRPGLPLRVFR